MISLDQILRQLEAGRAAGVDEANVVEALEDLERFLQIAIASSVRIKRVEQVGDQWDVTLQLPEPPDVSLRYMLVNLDEGSPPPAPPLT